MFAWHCELPFLLQGLGVHESGSTPLLAWGSIDFWDTISDEIQYWYYSSLQPLFIGAAGTQYCGAMFRDNVLFPADLGFVMAVTAVDRNGTVMCNSHFGPEVELTAVVENGVPAAGPVGRGSADVVSLSGSSAATAIIGGIAALTWSRYPSLTRDALWDRLRKQGWRFTNGLPKSDHTGYGILDAHRAVGGLADVSYLTLPRAGVRTKVVAIPNGDGPYTYLWPSGETTQTIYVTIPATATTYSFNAQVTDTYEGEVLSKLRTYTVYASPTLGLSGPSNVASKSIYTFTATHTGYESSVLFTWEEKACDSCAWSTLATTSSNVYSKTLQPNCTVGATTYEMRVTARDEWGGDKTATRTTALCGSNL